jgi:3-dehydroquinate dehydratase type II
MKVLILNGPNLNLLGTREPEIYGSGTYEDLCADLTSLARELNIDLEFFQSNHEGVLIDKIQSMIGKIDGLIINPAAFTHTSIALRDAVQCLGKIKKVEVHLSDISLREDFRKHSYFSDIVDLVIKGEGREGYKRALRFFLSTK